MIIECIFIGSFRDQPFESTDICIKQMSVEERRTNDKIFCFDTDKLNIGHPDTWSKKTLKECLETEYRTIKYFFTKKGIMGAYFHEMMPISEFEKPEKERFHLHKYLAEIGLITPKIPNL